MDSRFRLYLLFPALLLLAAFGLDKAFYIGDLEDYFLRTASFLNYDHKEDLVFELEAYLKRPQRRKVVVMFGNSRTMSFNNRYLERAHPEWILFNFSVPGGNADYYAFFMEHFRARNIRPELIFFAVSPQGYNRTPSIAMDEVMINGLSLGFVFWNWRRYNIDELSNFVAKKLFWNYQYRPKLTVIAKKLRNRKYHIRGFRALRVSSYYRLLIDRGSVPYHEHSDPKQDPEFLERTARGTWRDFFTPFTLSEPMFAFTEDFLRDARALGIPTRLLWARVGGPLRRRKVEEPVASADGTRSTVRQIWEPRMRALAARYNAPFVDMNYTPSIRCDRYYDASHLAGACFAEFTDFLLSGERLP